MQVFCPLSLLKKKKKIVYVVVDYSVGFFLPVQPNREKIPILDFEFYRLFRQDIGP